MKTIRNTKSKRRRKSPDLTRKEIALAIAAAPMENSQPNSFKFRLRLAGLNLEGLDLSGLNLRYPDFRGSILRHVSFRNCDLLGADFDGANCDGADFRGAFMEHMLMGDGIHMGNGSFIGANFAGVSLQNIDAEEADFRDADLSGADLSGACMPDANFAGADLSGARLTRTKIRRGGLDRAKGNPDTSKVIWWEREGEESPAPAVPEPQPEAKPAAATPWWIGTGYHLSTRVSARWQSREIAGVTIMVRRNAGDRYIAMLAAFRVSAELDAAKTMWRAGRFIEYASKNDLEACRELLAKDAFDWTDQPEPDESEPDWKRFGGQVWRDAYGQLEWLHHLIEKTCPPGDPVRDAFDLVRGYSDDLTPATAIPLQAIHAALDMVKYDSSLQRRRQILNDWDPESIMLCEREDLESLTAAESLIPVLEATALPGKAVEWSFSTIHNPSGTTVPVSLMIRPGTSKAEALACIDRMRDDIEVAWEGLISCPDAIRRQP